MKQVLRFVGWAMLGMVGIVFLAVSGLGFIVQVPVGLAFGWVGFLRNNVMALEVNEWRLAEAAATVALLAAGGHFALRWLHAQMAPAAPQPWRPRWTVAALGGVLLLFVAGVATIGLTHQAAWLMTSDAPFTDSDSPRWQVSSAMVAAIDYRKAVEAAHRRTGRFPDDNADAGAPAFEPRSTLKEVAVGKGGVITLHFKPIVAEGAYLTLTPTAAGGTVTWTCRSNLKDRYLPMDCRDVRP